MSTSATFEIRGLPDLLDLNACDFWIYGHLKSLVSRNIPKNLFDRKSNILRHVLGISQNTLLLTVEHAILRFQMVGENYGRHVKQDLL